MNTQLRKSNTVSQQIEPKKKKKYYIINICSMQVTEASHDKPNLGNSLAKQDFISLQWIYLTEYQTTFKGSHTTSKSAWSFSFPRIAIVKLACKKQNQRSY